MPVRGAAGCGGCDWQHVGPDAPAALKRAIVEEVAAPPGGGADVELERRTRSTATAVPHDRAAAVVGGRFGFRAAAPTTPSASTVPRRPPAASRS